MTCALHTTSQIWCRACDPDAESRGYSIVVGNPLLRETVVGVHHHEHRDRRALPSPSHDASAARIAGLEANVNEKLATIAALHDEIAQLRSVESVAIAAARIASLAAALRKALADVDPKAMSTYEQQQARREARALLEEVA